MSKLFDVALSALVILAFIGLMQFGATWVLAHYHIVDSEAAYQAAQISDETE